MDHVVFLFQIGDEEITIVKGSYFGLDEPDELFICFQKPPEWFCAISV